MGRDDMRLLIGALCGLSLILTATLLLAATLLLGGYIEPDGSLAVCAGESQWVRWGDVPTWGLLIGASITAWYARKAFKTQSKELAEVQAEGAEQRKVNEKHIAVLELQRSELEASLKQRVADADAARSAQALKIYVWTVRQQAGDRFVSGGLDYYVSGFEETIISAGPSFAVYVQNASSGPIYDVVVRADEGADDHLPLLLPDGLVVFYKPPEATWAVSDFRDANFALWSRDGSGRLVDRGDAQAEATGEVFVAGAKQVLPRSGLTT